MTNYHDIIAMRLKLVTSRELLPGRIRRCLSDRVGLRVHGRIYGLMVNRLDKRKNT